MTFNGEDQQQKIVKARSCKISHPVKHCDATVNWQKCLETNDPRVFKYAQFRGLLKPGLPSPQEVEQYCDDFEKTPEDIAKGIELISAQMRDASSSQKFLLHARKCDLEQVLQHQTRALKLVA